jgi:hypothetical protein
MLKAKKLSILMMVNSTSSIVEVSIRCLSEATIAFVSLGEKTAVSTQPSSITF